MFIRANCVFRFLSNLRFVTLLFIVFVSKYYQLRRLIVSSRYKHFKLYLLIIIMIYQVI
jgi:hypothetical protein